MAFKIQMPTEMKIRLAANVLAIVLAFVNAGYSAWYIAIVLNTVMAPSFDVFMLLFSIMSVAGCGLYFYMAKVMWALQKKTKKMGKILLLVVGVLGIMGGIFPVVNAADFTTAAIWSLFIGLVSGVSGLLIVAGKLIGEMVEKLKKLMYIGFVCLAGLVVLIILANTLMDYLHSVQVAALGALLVTIACLIVTILGYWAESVLIKKKLLVYS